METTYRNGLSEYPLWKATTILPHAGFWISLVILTLPVRQLSLWEIGGAHGRIGDLVLGLCVLQWFAAGSLKGRYAVVRNGLDLAVVVFLITYAASLLWASNIDEGTLRVMKLVRNGMLYVILVDYLSADFMKRYRTVAICLLLTGLMQSAAFIASLSQAGGIGAVSVVLQSAELPSNNPDLTNIRFDQGGGLFLRGAASWLPLCMFIGFGFAALVRTRLGTVTNWCLFLIMGVLTLLTFTRGAWIGLAVGFAVVALARVTQAPFRSLGYGIAIGVGLFGVAWYSNLAAVVQSRFTPDTLSNDPAVVERLEFFGIALARVLEAPLLGAGASSIVPGEFFVVHNVYLQVLGELGMIGGGLLIWIFGGWVWYLLSAASARAGDLRGKRVAVALLGATVFFLVYGLVGHDLGGAEMWILMGIASGMHNASDSRAFRRTFSPRGGSRYFGAPGPSTAFGRYV